MNGSERFSAVMNGKKPDRLPVIEWAPWWNLTVQRWENEGLQTKFRTYRDIYNIQRELGLDGCIQTFFNVRTALTPKAAHRGAGIITDEIADKALAMLEIDKAGLDHIDRNILMTMIEKFGGGPVGLETLAASVSEETDTIGDVYEPYLMQLGFINRTPRGRIVTPLGYEHLGIEPK